MSYIETGLVAKNRKAYHDYHIEEEYEAGIALMGSEVKSLRLGRCNITDAHGDLRTRDGSEELYLVNLHISEYRNANKFGHKATRPRKLLLHKREIKRLIGKVEQKGYTLIPLSIYFNNRGLAKVKLGLCKGKTNYDKRQDIKDKDWKREKERMLKNSD
jgi:SsrA-binding protein